MTTNTASPSASPGHPRGWRRLLVLLVPLLVAVTGQVALATPAHAGQVGVSVTIDGRGWVEVVEGAVGSDRVCSTEDHIRNSQSRTCQRWRAEAPFEAWVWLRAHAGSRETGIGDWRTNDWSGCDATRDRDGYRECGVHSGAFTSEEKAPRIQFEDRTSPGRPSIVMRTATDRDRTVEWTENSTSTPADLAGYRCTVDDGILTTCDSKGRIELSDGDHVMGFYSIDHSGNLSAERRVDFSVVDTRVVSGPEGTTNDTGGAFGFASLGGRVFRCSLDGAPEFVCGSSERPSYDFGRMSEGEHVLTVRATYVDWADPIPAERRWFVDTTAPSVAVSRMYVEGSEAAFRMERSEAGLTGECRWLHGTDDTGWSSCGDTAVRSGLAPGAHRFEARVRDAAGNVSTVAGEDFTIGAPDTTAPQTTLSGGPKQGAVVASRTARLTASSSETGGSLECTVDGRPTDCPDGRLALTDLAAGAHRVSVVAVDAAGNRDATPSVRRWVVPRSSRELSAANGFRQTDDATSWSGSTAVATKKGATLSTRVSAARTLALVVAPGSGQGSVTVRAGGRTVATVDLSRGNGRTVVKALPRLAAPYTGTVTITSTSAKPVRVQGLGWTG